MKSLTAAALLLVSLATAAHAEALNLQECLEGAARNNPALRTVAYERAIATEGERLAASGYLPKLNASGGYTAQLDPQGISVGGFSASTQQADYGFFSVRVDQTLYDFGRTGASLDRARALSEATRQEYRAREQEVFLRVVQAYYGILETEKLLLAADEEVRQMADHLKDANVNYQLGVVTRNDVLQGEVKLANSRQRRLDITRQLDNSWLLLNYLTGRESASRAALKEGTAEEALSAGEGTPALVASRPDILAAQGRLAASRADVSGQRAEFRPEIYLQAGADYQQNRYLQEQTILAATVGIRINVFDGFATSARLRQSVTARSQSEESLRETEQGALLEYRTAQNDARVAGERIGTTEKAIGQAEENLRLNRSRYEEQMGTSTEVVDAQTLLTQARTDYFQAVFDARVARARIKKALGRL